jgi:hypothetical protein
VYSERFFAIGHKFIEKKVVVESRGCHDSLWIHACAMCVKMMKKMGEWASAFCENVN